MINIMSRKCLEERAADVGDPIEPMDIQKWARDTRGGQLPEASARAFALWLNETWNEWTEEPDWTVEQVLQGAVSDWCGGRSF